MRGYVGDGLLVRGSVLEGVARVPFALVDVFFRDMIAAVAPAKRAGLIGVERAKLLQAV
jgi:hypothetical protein